MGFVVSVLCLFIIFLLYFCLSLFEDLFSNLLMTSPWCLTGGSCQGDMHGLGSK